MAHSSNHNDPNVLHPHITPMSTYLKVGGALFGLTFLTVIAHHFNAQLGALAAPVAFLIALIKAVLVLLYFMHLKDDTKLNRVIFASGFFFLVVLLFFSVLDIATRVHEVSPL
jgi:cytochrome c oxidase subunit 4